MARSEDERFEEDVRAVANQLFPGASFPDGRYADERERDGLFDDGDTIHIFEATTSRKKEKVENDISKSASLVAQIRRDKPGHNVKIWIITSDPPTVDQEQAGVAGRKMARCPVEVISYSTLYGRLFDARAFVRIRGNYPFGSVRNPQDDSATVTRDEYIKVGLLERRTGTSKTPDDIASDFSRSQYRAVILGDYGAGKSMALRYLYDRMAEKFLTGNTRKFPIYLNLRDHFGQSDPAEALMRHSTKVGESNHSRLISAWRAGFADLLLDGFDELSPAQFSTSSKNLRLSRRAAAELVANFVDESPNGTSILISGRRHYFDSIPEMVSSLGADSNWDTFDLGEFNEEQITSYLKLKGKVGAIPPWLPRRPLLLGYLAAWGLLDETIARSDATAADGWDYLLNRICEREIKQVPGAAVEAATLRLLLERLATFARSLEGGRGPILSDRISTIYESTFGQAPDARTQTLLLRLPGLAAVPGQEAAREFLDDDFVDACRAGDVARFLRHPFDSQPFFEVAAVEGGAIVTQALATMASSMTPKQISTAINQATEKRFDVISVDLLKATLAAGKSYVGDPTVIRDCYVYDMDLFTDTDCSGITFSDSWFERVNVFSDSDQVNSSFLPSFSECIIEELAGLKGPEELPLIRFQKSTKVERFVGLGSSNAEILTSDDIPLSVAVLLTIIKKMFFQAGGGRQEAALFRGLDHRARSYVPDVLTLLQRHGFIEASKRAGPTLWLAVKSKLPDAQAIRNAPMTSKHPLMMAVRALAT